MNEHAHDPSEPLAALWHRLQAIRRFSFEAVSGAESRTDWNGRGEGMVTVRLAEKALIFEEQGVYRTPRGTELSMSNIYRWERTEGTLRLSHLRRGAAVFLLAVEPWGGTTYRSRCAHQCVDDRYELSLDRRGEVLEAHWRIRGPKKEEDIRYQYR